MANTRVIVRQGSPFSPFDLKKVYFFFKKNTI